jgi:hypothetical protein
MVADAPASMAKPSEVMAKVWPSLPHFGGSNKPLVDCWPKWAPTADRWANDGPPLAPCPLVDKDDPVGINIDITIFLLSVTKLGTTSYSTSTTCTGTCVL